MSSLRDKFIYDIIDREGGYVDDPEDSGGETNFGITERVARRYGYTGDMKDLPMETAFDIYEKIYWYSINLDVIEEMSSKIAEELIDTAGNMGVYRAGEFLQRSLNAFNKQGSLYKDIKVDGDIGPRTLATLKTYIYLRREIGIPVFHRALNALQGAFYISLVERRQKDERFIFGWFANRVS